MEKYKEFLEEAAGKFLEWNRRVNDAQPIELHEAMKAILFSLSGSAKLEHRVIVGGHVGRIDFSDDHYVIEIDNQPNEKAFRKLGSVLGKHKIWILIRRSGLLNSKTHRMAAEYGVDILYIHPAPQFSWEWVSQPKIKSKTKPKTDLYSILLPDGTTWAKSRSWRETSGRRTGFLSTKN